MEDPQLTKTKCEQHLEDDTVRRELLMKSLKSISSK
jgi:hypothetical protein